MFGYFNILSLIFFGIVQIANAADLSPRETFYAKHHIEYNSLIPALFDKNECKRVFSELYDKKYADDLIKSITEDIMPPEQYSGFYPPHDKIVFYNTRHKENVHILGLSDKDIRKLDLDVTDDMLKQWRMEMTEQQLKDKGFDTILYTARLVARVGENIYLIGDYTDCGTAGCPIQMAVRKNDVWVFPRVDLNFAFCVVNDDKSEYECDISGGKSVSWRSSVADYKPLDELLNRYYEVYADYVEQYLQRNNKNTP